MFFMCHWQYRFWVPEVNAAGVPLRYAGANHFHARGAVGGRGHKVYVVSINEGHLYLGGRLTICRLVDREEAVRGTGEPELYEDTREWVLDETPEGGTRLDLHRRLAPRVTRRLRRYMADGNERGFCFRPDTPEATHLDPQATRNVPLLTPAAAELLEQMIAHSTTQHPREELLTITEDMLRDWNLI
jgi:hypothetical protein